MGAVYQRLVNVNPSSKFGGGIFYVNITLTLRKATYAHLVQREWHCYISIVMKSLATITSPRKVFLASAAMSPLAKRPVG